MRQGASEEAAGTWHAISEPKAAGRSFTFIKRNLAILALGGAIVVTLCFWAWTSWQRFNRISRELDETRLALSEASKDVERLQASFSSASVLHDLWGLASRFGDGSAGACRADDDKNKVRAATALAVEMWSDSGVRSEIKLDQQVLPLMHKLEQRGVRVAGAALPAGVVAQYRRFRRDALGEVVMLDASRIADSQSRTAVLDLLNRAAEGQLDPQKTTVIYRLDEYGKVSYHILQGPSDQPLLQASVLNDPLAKPVTVTVADFPCS